MSRDTISLMEKRAKAFGSFGESNENVSLPTTEEAISRELLRVKTEMKLLEQHISAMKVILEPKQRHFLELANYKYLLEKKVTPVGKVLTKKERDLELLRKLEALSPEELEKVGRMEI